MSENSTNGITPEALNQMFTGTVTTSIKSAITSGALDVNGIHNLLHGYRGTKINGVDAERLIVAMLWDKVLAVEALLATQKQTDVPLDDHVKVTLTAFFDLMTVDDPTDAVIGGKSSTDPNFRNANGALDTPTNTDKANRYSAFEAVLELALGALKDAGASNNEKHAGSTAQGKSQPRDADYDAASTNARLNGSTHTYANAYFASTVAAQENNTLISFQSNEVSGQAANQHNKHGTETRAVFLLALAAVYNIGKVDPKTGERSGVTPIFGDATKTFRVTQYKTLDTTANNQSGCYCFTAELDVAGAEGTITSKEYKYFASGVNGQTHFMNILAALYNEPKSVTGEDYGYFPKVIEQEDLMRLVASTNQETRKFSAASYLDLYRASISKPTSTSTVDDLNKYYDLGNNTLDTVYISHTSDLTIAGTFTSASGKSHFFGPDATSQAGNVFGNGVGVFGNNESNKFTITVNTPPLFNIFASNYGSALRALFKSSDGKKINLESLPLLFALTGFDNTGAKLTDTTKGASKVQKNVDAFLNQLKLLIEESKDLEMDVPKSIVEVINMEVVGSSNSEEIVNEKMTAILKLGAYESTHANGTRDILYKEQYLDRSDQWKWVSAENRFANAGASKDGSISLADDLFPNAKVHRNTGGQIVIKIFEEAVKTIMSELSVGQSQTKDNCEKALEAKASLFALVDELASLSTDTSADSTAEKLISLVKSGATAAGEQATGPLISSGVSNLKSDLPWVSNQPDQADDFMKAVTLLSLFRELCEGSTEEIKNLRDVIFNNRDDHTTAKGQDILIGAIAASMVKYVPEKTDASGKVFKEKIENRFTTSGTDTVANGVGVGGKSYSSSALLGTKVVNGTTVTGVLNPNIIDFQGASSNESTTSDFTEKRAEDVCFGVLSALPGVSALVGSNQTRGMSLDETIIRKERKSLAVRFQLIQDIELTTSELLLADVDPEDNKIIPDFSITNNKVSVLSADANLLLQKVSDENLRFCEYTWNVLTRSKEMLKPNGDDLTGDNALLGHTNGPLKAPAAGVEDPLSKQVTAQVDLRDKMIVLFNDPEVKEDHVVEFITLLYNNRSNVSNASNISYGGNSTQSIKNAVEFLARAISRSYGRASDHNRVPHINSDKLSKKVQMWLTSRTLADNNALEQMLDLTDPVTSSGGNITSGVLSISKSRLLFLDTKLADMASVLVTAGVTPEDIAEDTDFHTSTNRRSKNHLICWMISLKTDKEELVNEQVDSLLKPAGFNRDQYNRVSKLVPERELIETVQIRQVIETMPNGRVTRVISAYHFFNVDDNGSFIEKMWDLNANSPTAGEAIEKPEGLSWQKATEPLVEDIANAYTGGSGLGESSVTY